MSLLAEFAEKGKRKGIINLAIGELNFSCPDEVKRAMKEAIDDNKTNYTSNSGIEELRKLAAFSFKASGVKTANKDNTIIGPGSKILLSIAIKVLLSRSGKKEVILPSPFYPPYKEMVIGSEGVVREIDTSKDGFLLRGEKIQEVVSRNTNFIIFNSPNNPTGTVWHLDDFEGIDKNVWWIIDEAYYHLQYGAISRKNLVFFEEIKDRAIIIRSFSKTFAMPGLRIGYLTGPDEIVAEIKPFLVNYVGCPSSIGQWGAIAALEKCMSFPENVTERLNERRKYLLKWLSAHEIGFPVPCGAFYVFADFSQWGNSINVANILFEEANIAVAPGIDFGDFDGWIRMSYASVSLEELKKALSRIEKVFF